MTLTCAFSVLCFVASASFAAISNPRSHFKVSNALSSQQRNTEDKIEILLNLDLKEQFQISYNNQKCIVYDLEKREQIFIFKNFVYPYENDDESLHLFNDSYYTDAHFLCSDGEYLWEPGYSEYTIPLSQSRLNDPEYIEAISPIYSIPYSSHAILNYNYFLSLNNWHSNNPNSICGLIALQIFAGYYDNFIDDNYVPEKWDKVPSELISNPASWLNWSQSPGTGYQDSPIADFRMAQYLLDYTESNINPYVTTFGLTCDQLKNIINYYLGQRNVSYSLNVCGQTIGNAITQATKTFIQNNIDNNCPVIGLGGHHFCVAFAYDNSYVYVHDGWGQCAAVYWNVFTDYSISFFPAAISLTPLSSHSHSNNYYSTHTNKFYCSCGQDMNGKATNFASLQIPSTPSSNVNTTSYSDGFSMSVSFSNTYKNSSNHLVLTGFGQLTFYGSSPIYGIHLRGINTYSNHLPIIQIDFYSLPNLISFTYSLTSLSYFRDNNVPEELSLNCPSTTRGIRIRTTPYSGELLNFSIQKLIFEIN